MPLFQPDINHQTAQSLFDLVGPGSAGQYIGEQGMMRRLMNPVNAEMSLADLDKIQQANDQSRVINPLEADIKRGEARQANSRDDAYYKGVNSGVLAEARSKGVKADIDEATKGTSIQATNSDNKLKAIQNLGKEVSNVASYIGTLPVQERTVALSQIAGQHPEIAQSPVFQQLMKLPPEKLQPVLAQISERMIAATPELFNARQIHAETNASHERVANTQAAATRYSADARKKDISADQVATLRKEAAKGNPEAFLMLADLAKESGDMVATQRYTELAKQAALRREAERRAGSVGKADIGAMGIPAQGSNNPYGTARPDPLGIR